MSYKAAWDALDDLNNLADAPVIERSIGGAGGGGSKLTEYGRKLIAMFRAIESEYQVASPVCPGRPMGRIRPRFSGCCAALLCARARATSSPAPCCASIQVR
jgi:hypothetical protein